MRENRRSCVPVPGEVHIWSRSLRATHEELGIFSSSLNPKERLRANQYIFEKDRSQFILSRGWLREVLSSYLDVLPGEIDFQYNSFGRPFLSSPKGLFFNLSHSGDRILIAIADNPLIGIDVERIWLDKNVDELAQVVLSEQEITQLHSIPEDKKRHGFFKAWTQKEAFIKAIGLGLNFPVQEISVDLDPDQEAKILKTRRAIERETISLVQLNWFKEHAVSLATGFSVSRILRYEY